jgi:hypothetical protein
MAYQQTTLADLRASLRDRTEFVPWWTDDDADAALNEAVRVWSCATAAFRTSVSQVTVPNDPFVALPGTLMQVTRLLFAGTPMERVSLTDLNLTIPNWRGTTTATAGAPTTPIYWAPLSLSLLVIYPADAASHALTVEGIRATPLLIAEDDFIDVGAEELNQLLGYAVHALAFKNGGQTLASTYPQWVGFLKAAAEHNQQFARSAFYRRVQGQDQLRRIPPVESQAQPTLLDELGQRAARVGLAP